MKNGRRYAAIALLSGAGLLLACRTDERSAAVAALPQPPLACTSAWSDGATDLVDRLARATSADDPVWLNYGLSDGTYVVYAGDSPEGEACLGVWQGGKARAYTALTAGPKLLTPLYGYHYPWQGNGGPFDPLVANAAQPAEVATWLAGAGVESAVIVPVHVSGLPFEVSRATQVQIALHEAFHVEVQAPRWLGPGGDWPAWDLQPDRAATRACYAADTSVAAVFTDERQALEQLITALLDGKQADACQAGESFLRRRSARYEMLESISVAGHDGAPVSCGAAESIMELEEGTADFASWSQLFQLGQASRDDLMRRYRAEQAEPFYLTGAMQLHAVYLMDPGQFIKRTAEIASTPTPREGSLTAVLTRVLGAYCR